MEKDIKDYTWDDTDVVDDLDDIIIAGFDATSKL